MPAWSIHAIKIKGCENRDPPGTDQAAERQRLGATILEGDKNIAPDADTQRAIATAGKKLVGTFKLCINKSGAISGVKVLKPTGFERYDQTIEQQMLTWKYRPFEVDGKPAPVCTAITFVYSPDSPK